MAQSGSRSKGATAATKRLQYLILGFVGLVALAVVTYGLVYSSGSGSGEFVEGTHYEIIEDAPARRPSEPVVVTEYFSYGCIHCKNFDPLIEDWKPTLAEQAKFERAPVNFSPAWELLARAYLAFETLGQLEDNHSRLFRAIHENGRQFLSADQLANFAARGGVEKESFLRQFNSSQTSRRIRQIEQAMLDAGVRSVPNLVVAGKYRINNNVGRKVTLDVVDYLIAKELAANGS